MHTIFISIAKTIVVKRKHMNADVVKQFHSFTDTKPIQIVVEEREKKATRISKGEKNQNKIFMYCWRRTKNTHTHTHSRINSFSYRFDAKHVCAINNAKKTQHERENARKKWSHARATVLLLLFFLSFSYSSTTERTERKKKKTKKQKKIC